MSTEIPPERTTAPSAPEEATTAEPDAEQRDTTKQAASAALLTASPTTESGKPGTVKPDNWHVDTTKG